MKQRIPGYVIAVAVTLGVFGADAVFAQTDIHHLQSLEDFLPVPPNLQKNGKLTLPPSLAEVPEVHFQQPLTKAMKPADAQLHIKSIIDKVHLLNKKKTDGFIEALLGKRVDLAGLPFAMGDACRMTAEASRDFASARKDLRDGLSLLGKRTLVSKDGTAVPVVYKDGEFVPATVEDALAAAAKENGTKTVPSSQTAALMQMLACEDAKTRLGLIKYLDGLADVTATRALAKLAIFSQEDDVRRAAARSLKLRRDSDCTDILLAGLNYPWPQVAERTSAAIVQIGRTDLIPQLIGVLERPDPRSPRSQEINGKKTTVVRELVRINHHHNCLLCHAPATAQRDGLSKEETEKLAPLTAQIPVPSEAMNAYYSPNNPDILVRFDVTYLRQDFSMNLPVKDAHPWPEMQRYDYLVRTRALTDQEAAACRKLLQPGRGEAVSPYHRAALSALRELTGRDAGPTAAAWRKITPG